MELLLYPFVLLAAIGLVLSFIVHVMALLGLPAPFGQATFSLHVGILIVWIPTILVGMKMTKDFKRKDFWKAMLRGCPNWMKYMTYGLFIYAAINFIIFFYLAPPKCRPFDPQEYPTVFCGFSGHWMAFYSAEMASLYSAIKVIKLDPLRRCPDGHPVSPSAKYCDECGREIV